MKISVQTNTHQFFKDKNLMKVLSSVRNSPKSAKEISSECNLPISTVYRKLHLMNHNGLLKTSGTITDNGVKTRKFAKKQILSQLA
ncbi:MAG: hypothetical protein ACT4OW_00185 [Nitrososphaerota archaeon]